eukprot:574348-Hanusia_phi.AAC.3
MAPMAGKELAMNGGEERRTRRGEERKARGGGRNLVGGKIVCEVWSREVRQSRTLAGRDERIGSDRNGTERITGDGSMEKNHRVDVKQECRDVNVWLGPKAEKGQKECAQSEDSRRSQSGEGRTNIYTCARETTESEETVEMKQTQFSQRREDDAFRTSPISCILSAQTCSLIAGRDVDTLLRLRARIPCSLVSIVTTVRFRPEAC